MLNIIARYVLRNRERLDPELAGDIKIAFDDFNRVTNKWRPRLVRLSDAVVPGVVKRA